MVLLAQKKVFIVDDDESVCRALKMFLRTCDFEVKTFQSAHAFFEAVAHEDPGCLVLDIHMPEVDGWTMHKKLVDSGSTRPVIFISAEKEEKAAERALKAGAVGYLQKPVHGPALADLINLALDNNDE